MSLLSPETLESWHTAGEYLPWVKSLIAEVKTEPDGLERIRLRRSFAKELVNEALPIGHLAERYFGASGQVRIKLKIGNQNYDALVVDERNASSGVRHIEVTLAGDGESDYLRMRALHESGEVSGLGRVCKIGSNKTRLNITVADEMVSQPEILKRERARLSEAIERKLGKSYPPNTLLLLAFDDTMAFGRPDNFANLQSVLLQHSDRLQAFHSVAVVGMQRGTFLSWSKPDAI